MCPYAIGAAPLPGSRGRENSTGCSASYSHTHYLEHHRLAISSEDTSDIPHLRRCDGPDLCAGTVRGHRYGRCGRASRGCPRGCQARRESRSGNSRLGANAGPGCPGEPWNTDSDPFQAHTGLVVFPDRVTVASARELGRVLRPDFRGYQCSIFDLSRTLFVDDPAAVLMSELVSTAMARHARTIIFADMNQDVSNTVHSTGLLDRVPEENYVSDVEEAKPIVPPLHLEQLSRSSGTASRCCLSRLACFVPVPGWSDYFAPRLPGSGDTSFLTASR